LEKIGNAPVICGFMNYTLEFTETPLADLEKHKKSGDKAVLKKIEKLLNYLTIYYSVKM